MFVNVYRFSGHSYTLITKIYTFILFSFYFISIRNTFGSLNLYINNKKMKK